MTKHFGRMAAVALLLLSATPLTAGAQTPAEIEAAKRRAAPAARPAPATRPAPPPAAARPAPPPAAARPAPPPAARAAPPRPQPPAARIAPQRPQPPAARIAPPSSQAPAAAARRDQFQQRIQQRGAERQRQQTPQAPAVNRAQRNAPAQAVTPNAAQRGAAPAAAVAPAQNRQQLRQQQSQERLLQRREDRALRSLPPAQRATRREEIQRARTERATQRQQAIQPAGRAGIAAQPNAAPANVPNARVNALAAARVNRGPRRSGQARVAPLAASQGRFAAAFASPQAANFRAARAMARANGVAPRRAWRSGRRASFVAWYGPVFYPYAYSDIFDYAFWPRGYDDDYWYVAYDDFFDGVFFGEVGQPEEYVGSIGGAPRVAAPTYKAVQEVCKQPGSGITAWPVAEIESKVGLNGEQKQLLGDVKTAGAKAASVFSATCPTENAFPLTPTGRLASMTARLDATLEAVQTVRPAL
ncbi:MAG: Spy/CpxP family protein refolding chaperone, partial [Pseudolabrys sp.]|nr:Spy/CpxP family protein refolding chaperone [Pseudolabrys sp.]